MSDAPDIVEVSWVAPGIDGRPLSWVGRLTLDEAARLERGEPARWLSLETWRLEDLQAARRAAEDRLARVEAERFDLAWRHGLVDGAS